MTDSISKRIKAELSRIETAEQVTILYACESGSRAWGFESVDSDYDVRFIYVRRIPWYLTVQSKKDFIEKPIDDELDISGWDVPKVLKLLRKSNPPLLEWLQSPTVYMQKSSFVDRLRGLTAEYYSPIGCMHHYMYMARKNFRKYLQRESVWTKKYFYVLRPVLACMWIEQGLGVVPIEFARLVDRVVVDGELKKEIGALLEVKRSGAKMDRGPKNLVISDFLEKEIDRIQAESQGVQKTRDSSPLDQLYVDVLREVNGARVAED